jgi:hypothetical protein
MSCQNKACSDNDGCFTKNTTSGLITSNGCCDPNNNCTCSNGTCVSTTCTDDSYCQSALGSGCACVNGLCTCSPCDSTKPCPVNMYCNGGICATTKCDSRSNCPDWMVCKNGYCVHPTPIAMWKILIILIITAVVCAISYAAYRYRKNHQ